MRRPSMKRTNYGLAIASLGLGAAMVCLALGQRGLDPSLGLIFGSLLLLNAALRLWAARRA